MTGFNEIAEHDVFRGKSQVRPARWFGDGLLQSVYFKGLVTLRILAEAKTYDQQYELFDHGRLPKTRSPNLYETLRGFDSELNGNEETSVSDYENAQDYALKVRRPYFEDPDGGPFCAWEWAHGSAPLSLTVYSSRQPRLRRWGYIMWDRARLETLAICRDGAQQQVVRSYRPSPDGPARGFDGSWRVSWKERERIHDEGGRGWWDFGDESMIVWTGKKEISRKEGSVKHGSATTQRIPASVDEAKRIILSLAFQLVLSHTRHNRMMSKHSL